MSATTKPKCLLMKPGETIPIKKAVARTQRNDSTIRRWCSKHGIARQTSPNAPLEISILGLEMVLHADLDALELLRAGDRSHPDVLRYFDHLGLQP